MRKTNLFAIAVSISLPLFAQGQSAAPRADHYVDHVVLGINDLERGMDAVARMTGVKPRFDGNDPRLGTHSAVIALGEDSFLEIMAPDPKADPAAIVAETRPVFLDRLAALEELTPFQWAIGTGNLDLSLRLARRAGNRPSNIMDGSRKLKWGRELDWNYGLVWRPVSAITPLFVQWKSDTKPPQTRARGNCQLTALKIQSRNYKAVHALIAATQVDAVPEGAEEDALTFTLSCGGKEVVFEPRPLTVNEWVEGNPNL